MKYEIILNNGKVVKFSQKVEEILQFQNMLIVRIESPMGVVFNENIYGVDLNGVIIWQIPKVDHVHENSPYTGMKLAGDSIILYSREGVEHTIEPKTGKIIKKELVK